MFYYETDRVFAERISEDKTYFNNLIIRTFLDIPLRRPGNNTASVVMINPSDADKFSGDSTIDYLIEYIFNHDLPVSRLVIHNSIPVVMSSPEGLQECYDSLYVNGLINTLLKSNLKSIQDTINYYNPLYNFLAWGGGSSVNAPTRDALASPLINFFQSYNQNLYVFGTESGKVLIKNKYPRHPKPLNGEKATSHHQVEIINSRIQTL